MKKLLAVLFILSLIFSCGKEKSSTFTDSRDNKAYKTVTIGKQTWMAENLAYLPSVNKVDDGSETESKYYVYDYDGTDVSAAKTKDNYKKYGVLYNYTAALTACPSGWHLPTDAEWKQLEMHLGMSQSDADENWAWRNSGNVGKKLKSTSGWNNNGNGTNISGFTALPGGYRNTNDTFNPLGSYGYWWSSTTTGSSNAYFRNLNYNIAGVNRYDSNKSYGFSVRCVRD